jgi:PadR family transcriptional regulator AphA
VAQASPQPAIKEEQVLRVLCFDLLPRRLVLEQIKDVRDDHQTRLDFFKTRLALLEESHTGPRLVVRCGILAEEAYIAWCDEVTETLTQRLA